MDHAAYKFCVPYKKDCHTYALHRMIALYFQLSLTCFFEIISMTQTTTEKYRRFLKRFSTDDHVLIVINADPDAIASAMAVKRLLWRNTASVTISNINLIKRPDNLAMVRLLSVKLTHISDIAFDKFNRFVMVDSQPDHHEAFAGFTPDVIIDHHPETGFKAPFMDIRSNYGATASIMTEYLRAAKIKPASKLATGLFYAIKTDTQNFQRQALIEDIQAFQFLFRLVNIHLAKKIEQSELRFDFLKYFKTALQEMCVRRNRVFVYLGPVANPDICVLIADFFMKVNAIKWSAVSGMFDNKLIIILRNDGIQKNAGKVAKQCFGAFGSAGGHKSMARAELLINDLFPEESQNHHKVILDWIIDRIEERA
jgi:nanoRNase/pAp phosphatase (c-di-AMP/oligoRNAs hydrolase)